MKKTLRLALFCVSLLFFLCHALFLSPLPGEGYDMADLNRDMDGKKAANTEVEKFREGQKVEIEYEGRIISVDVEDLILLSDGRGGEKLGVANPEQYDGDPFESAVPSRVTSEQEITAREYGEEQRARRWADVVEDLELREIDERALALVKEFGEAKNAVPPAIGASGSVVITHSSYTPKIVCRPMYVTDVILQAGETVTGVHPGDPVRWSFVPSKSGTGDAEQIHVLIKPLMADISTNLVVNTDRRTYQLNLMSSAAEFIPSVSFSYPGDSMREWNTFIAERKKERENGVTLASGHELSPEDLHLDYQIRGKDSLRWKPVRVWDDGTKTYIRFRKGSTKKSVEAPVLVVFEHKKEILVNYRVLEDMYVVDRVFGKAALIAGTGARQDRVVLTRLRSR